MHHVSSGSKRARPEELDISSNNSSSISQSHTPISDSRKSSGDVDKWRILSQDLKVKYNLEKDERQREKDRFLRQLEFMETELKTLRKTLADKSEKFYEEKRALHTKIRDLEATAGATTSGVPCAITSVRSEDNEARSDLLWTERLEGMEETVREKIGEITKIRQENALMEDKYVQLEQAYTLLKHKIAEPSKENNVDTANYRQKCSELEALNRDKSRIIEKLERKLSNQNLLEQEIGSLNSKLSNAKESADVVSAMQSSIQKLMQERDEWHVLFNDAQKHHKLITDPDSVELITDKLDTPVQVLRLLRRTQETAALFMRKAAEFESLLATTKKQNVQIENKYKSLEAELVDSKSSVENSAMQRQVLTKQSELFEKEVVSLRMLLKSFDAECRIGRPEVASILSSKDEIIESCRSLLDSAREETKVTLQRNSELQLDIAKLHDIMKNKKEESHEIIKQEAPNAVEQRSQSELLSENRANNSETNNVKLIASLRAEVDKLSSRLQYFKRSFGVDHIESETRVRLTLFLRLFIFIFIYLK